MSMPLSPTRLFVCTACGAVLPVGPEHLGKKCRCGRCGKISVVAEDSPRRRAERSPASNQSTAQRIHFYCRVCDTHLAARAQDVGRKAKCHDCGALTKVPPPPKQRPKKVPQAMHGQQYGLWGVDDAPSSAELKAKQPKFFPIYCHVCDTLMHARPEQIGKKLACPDCGAKTTVVEPPKPEPKKSPLVPDGREYQLDATHIPPPRQMPQFTHPQTLAQEAKAAADPIRQERVDRPKIPRLPILQGVMKMLVRMPVVAWFCWLSAVGMTVAGFMMFVVSLNPIAAIPFFIAAGASAIMGLCAFSAISLAVLTESSEGNDRLYNPPGAVFLDWIGDVFYLVTSAVLALAPWWLLCTVLEQNLPKEYQGLVLFVGWLFTFPLLLLSCLENGSPMEPYSHRVFGSLSKRPGHWLLFVVESAVLVGGTVAAIGGLLTTSPTVALLVVPVCVASILLYFRVLGRFAWWLAESLAVPEKETERE